jgi:hypothetical protein
VLQGQAVSVIDNTAAPNVSVQVGRTRAVTTDVNGYFQTDVGDPGSYTTSLTGDAIVTRLTMVTGPAAERVRVSLIPASFDLIAFDAMFRTANARLQRWNMRPSLVVVAATMAYTGTSSLQYDAKSDGMSDDEVTQLVAHLTEGLSILTGGTYTSFASVSIEHPAAGASVSVARTGSIVVGRFTGMVGMTEVIGFGRWEEQSDGTVTGGSIYLDHDFDKNDSRRRLLRIHELGHALGYNHVTTRTSIMNPSIGPDVTDFDRTGAVIAFQRPIGNLTPDTDPGAANRPFSFTAARWVAPIP